MTYGLVELSDSLLQTLLTGSLYTLLALGLSLTLSVLKIPNLAHAELITIGAYTATAVTLFASVSVLTLLIPAFVVSGTCAVLFYVVIFRPLERLKASSLILMVASFAVSLIVRYILFVVADVSSLTYYQPHIINYISFQAGNIRITDLFLVSLPLALACVMIMHYLLNSTRFGKSMRALANNKNLAIVVGINIEIVSLITWIIVGGLAGIGGALWAVYTAAQPDLGWVILFTLFAASLLGNFKFYGTIIGSFILAFSETTVMGILNAVFGLSLAFKPAVPLVVIVVVLLVRPKGLGGLNLSGLGVGIGWRKKN